MPYFEKLYSNTEDDIQDMQEIQDYFYFDEDDEYFDDDK